jgi:hypothetical protein
MNQSGPSISPLAGFQYVFGFVALAFGELALQVLRMRLSAGANGFAVA